MTWRRQQLRVMLLRPDGPALGADLCVCGQCGERTSPREPLALALMQDRGDGVPVQVAPHLLLCRRCFLVLANDLGEVARRAVLQNDYAGALRVVMERGAQAAAARRGQDGERD